MKSTQVYDFNIPAGGSQRLQVAGSYFRLMTSTDVLEVDGDSFGNIFPLRAGQGLRGQDFNTLTLVNRTGAANIGTILVSDANFVDDRITGEVSVIDGEKSRTLAGGMYAGAPAVGGLAGNFSSVQLWNLSGNTKNLIVTALDVNASAASNGILLYSATQLPTLYNIAATNKKSNGPAPSGLLKVNQQVAGETFAMGILKNTSTSGAALINWNIKGALVISPGYGLNLYNNVIGQGIGANFEWFEELA